MGSASRRVAIVIAMACLLANVARAQEAAVAPPSTQGELTQAATDYYAGRHAQALPVIQRWLAAARRELGDEDTTTLDMAHMAARSLRALGRFEEAEPLDRQTWAIRRRVLGEDNADTLASANNLSLDLHEMGQTAEAEAIIRPVWQRRRALLGEEHPDTLAS